PLYWPAARQAASAYPIRTFLYVVYRSIPLRSLVLGPSLHIGDQVTIRPERRRFILRRLMSPSFLMGLPTHRRPIQSLAPLNECIEYVLQASVSRRTRRRDGIQNARQDRGEGQLVLPGGHDVRSVGQHRRGRVRSHDSRGDRRRQQLRRHGGRVRRGPLRGDRG